MNCFQSKVLSTLFQLIPKISWFWLNAFFVKPVYVDCTEKLYSVWTCNNYLFVSFPLGLHGWQFGGSNIRSLGVHILKSSLANQCDIRMGSNWFAENATTNSLSITHTVQSQSPIWFHIPCSSQVLLLTLVNDYNWMSLGFWPCLTYCSLLWIYRTPNSRAMFTGCPCLCVLPLSATEQAFFITFMYYICTKKIYIQSNATKMPTWNQPKSMIPHDQIVRAH